MSFKYKCWGPRGSLPSPSLAGSAENPEFLTWGYGGNTSCYHLQAGPFSVIMDMGSGIKNLGNSMFKRGIAKDREHIVLISHYHWDHLQGGPFFGPFFMPTNKFHFHGFAPAGKESDVPFNDTVKHLLAEQQVSPHFPIAHGSMPSKKEYHTHQRQTSESFWYYIDEAGKLHFQAEYMEGVEDKGTLPATAKADPTRWIKITTIPLAHPDGCLGYLVEYMGDALLYATDVEPLRHPNLAICKAVTECKAVNGVKIVVLDGQYTEKKLATVTQTYGHGTPESCIDQAFACNLPEDAILLIHHHDPDHDDNTLHAMEVAAVAYAQKIGLKCRIQFAREGTVWEF